MKTIKLLNEHGVKTTIIKDENGNPYILADNEDGTCTKFDYYTATSIICEFLGY